MNKKKILSLVLACLLLAGALAGCGSAAPVASGEADSSSSTPSTTSKTSESSMEATPEAPKEVITLTMYSRDAGALNPGLQDTPVSRIWEEKFGIKLDITPSQLVPEYEQKVAAMLAGGDLPDIIWSNADNTKGATLQKSMVESGAILALDDLIEAYGPDIKRDMMQRLDYARKYQTYGNEDNKVYFLRWSGDGGAPTLRPTYGLYVRWDLYKQLGYPKVEDKFDLVDVLADMVALQPETPSGQKTYATTTCVDWGMSWNIVSLAREASPEKIHTPGGDLLYYPLKDELTTGWFTDKNSPLYQEGYKFFNKLNQKGLVDPDSFIQKWTDMEAKTKAGRYMLLFYDWYVPTLTDQPEAEFLPMAPETDANSYQLSDPNPFGLGGYSYSISERCEYPDRAMQFLNYLSSPEGNFEYYNGVEGIHWNLEDGVPTMTPEMEAIKMNNDYDAMKNELTSFNQIGHAGTAVYEKYGIPYDLKLSPKAVAKSLQSPMKQDYMAHYGTTNIMDVFLNAPQIKTTVGPGPYTALREPTIPDNIKDINANVTAYTEANWPMLVLAKDDAAFDAAVDKFIDGLKKTNIDVATDWYLTETQKALDIYKSMVGK